MLPSTLPSFPVSFSISDSRAAVDPVSIEFIFSSIWVRFWLISPLLLLCCSLVLSTSACRFIASLRCCSLMLLTSARSVILMLLTSVCSFIASAIAPCDEGVSDSPLMSLERAACETSFLIIPMRCCRLHPLRSPAILLLRWPFGATNLQARTCE